MRHIALAVTLPLSLATFAFAAAPATRPATQPQATALRVLTADGKPVADATVVVVPTPPKIDRYFIYDGTLCPWVAGGYRQSRTDASGTCSAVLPDGPGRIVAMHERGWADVDVSTRDIRLSPWATVSGRAFRGGKPAAGWSVQVQLLVSPETLQSSRVLSLLLTTADADGRFTFKRVPPGRTRVSLMMNPDGTRALGYGVWLRPVNVDLEPGRAIEVQVGGDGRLVEGSVVLPAGVERSVLAGSGYLAHRVAAPPTGMPENVRNGTAEQRTAWMDAFKKTPAYAAWKAAADKAMADTTFTPITWTGPTTFLVIDVPAGDYRLEFNEGRWTADAMTFTVPTGKPTDPPVVVPTAVMRKRGVVPKVGDVAPDFTLATLDGRPVKLSDYRGRFVLVDTWATWCGPCIAEIPNLRATHDAFAGEKFAILSVSFDESAAVARKYVDAQKLPWDQAWVGSPSNALFSESYTRGLPTITLVGPDGRVVATDLREAGIRDAVEKVMK